MVRLRRPLFVLRIAAQRLVRRPGRAALVVLGLAAGAAALAAVLAGSLVARDRASARAVRALSGADRAVRVTWLGVPGQSQDEWEALGRRATRALGGIVPERPFGVLLYRETRFGDALADLGAVEGLARWARVSSGRMPRTCRPARCEVLQIGGQGRIPHVPGLRLVVVGHGSLTSEVPFGSLISPTAYNPTRARAIGYHAPAPPPLLLAEGVSAMARARYLVSIYRSYAWVVPLRPEHAHPWQLGSLARRVARTTAALHSASSFFDLDTPVEQLQASAAESRAGARRLLLIGGQAAALLLAFALLSGSSLRRDHEASRRRLAWAGATRAQLMLLTFVEATAVALVATVLGFALGAGVGALLAEAAGSPGGPVLRHSLVTSGGLALLAGAAAATALLTTLALVAGDGRAGRAAIGPLEIGALGALVAVVFGFARGSAGPEELARGGGTGVLLALLPGLAAFVAAVVCARGAGPLLRLAGREARRASVPLRLALLSLARHPGRSALAVSFLVVSVGLALFAATYRSTLAGNEADEAAFSVPDDFIVEEDFGRLEYPLEAAPLARYAAVVPGAQAYPVTRVPADVTGAAGGIAPTVLGIPASALGRLRGWRDDFSDRSAAQLAARIAPPRPLSLRGVPIAESAETISVDASVRGNAIALFADLAEPDGGFVEVRLGEARPGEPRPLRAAVPEDAHLGRLVALRLGVVGPRNADAFNVVARGALTLGPLRVGSRVTRYPGWIGVDGVRRGSGTRLRYVVSNEIFSRFRPRQPTDGRPVPAIVSPSLAATVGPGGTLPVDFGGQQLLVRVAGVAQRVPSVDGDFVLADESWLTTALNADTPGSGLVQEIWLRVPPSERDRAAAALARPPFADLDHRSRAAVEAALRREPLARGTLLTLGAAGIAALVLAVAGLLLALLNDLRDERGELLDLETQGAAPAALRRHLRLRAAIVTAAGAVGGIALGAVLTVLVVDLVALTANAVLPQPPLRLYLDWTAIGIGAAAYVAATCLVVGLATWLPFREARPRLAAEPEVAL